jgi:hypothetical protein
MSSPLGCVSTIMSFNFMYLYVVMFQVETFSLLFSFVIRVNNVTVRLVETDVLCHSFCDNNSMI